jgi:hypothetical protein
MTKNVIKLDFFTLFEYGIMKKFNMFKLIDKKCQLGIETAYFCIMDSLILVEEVIT